MLIVPLVLSWHVFLSSCGLLSSGAVPLLYDSFTAAVTLPCPNASIPTVVITISSSVRFDNCDVTGANVAMNITASASRIIFTNWRAASGSFASVVLQNSTGVTALVKDLEIIVVNASMPNVIGAQSTGLDVFSVLAGAAINVRLSIYDSVIQATASSTTNG